VFPEEASLTPLRDRFSLRFSALVVLFASELILISFAVDLGSLHPDTVLSRLLIAKGAWTLRAFLAAVAVLALIAFLQWRPQLSTFVHNTEVAPMRPGALAGHILTASLCLYLGFHLSDWRGTELGAALVLWILAGFSAIALGVAVFVPFDAWLGLFRSIGWPLLLAPATALLACLLGFAGWSLWEPLRVSTFELVALLTRSFAPNLTVDPATYVIGTGRFSVSIAPECSGLEGLGLMTAFAALWLWLSRSELRFPRALLMLPVGWVLLWFLNAARIAALLLIGDCGFPRIAAEGFHSQAGWLTFNVVALGFVIAAGKVTWLRRATSKSVGLSTGSDRMTPALLMPFLALLLAGMVARAASGGFEWLYPLRVVAVTVVLWHYRKDYQALDWRYSWLCCAAGVAVFALWLALEPTGSHAGTLGFGLATLTPFERLGWLAFRVVGATVTVPLAEEMAFRAYLLRRLTASSFTSVDPRTVTPLAIAISSLAFGAMHGDRWVAGTLTGAIFALVFRWRGRFGDAVAAHAIANLLLAGWVLATGNWGLW
jgi:exosortase E/protease (VPEID-CTERM system)